MARDQFYNTESWRRLRAQALQRDNHTCGVKGCGQPAVVVDHIRPRKQGGPDALPNLRCLCRLHDNQAHREKGARTAAGAQRVERLTVPGCTPAGLPIDPAHPWNRPKR